MKSFLPLTFALLALPLASSFAQKTGIQTANSSPVWIPMPLLTPEAAKAGIAPGGEGAQWPRALVISQSNPEFLLLAIDVGGLYRSLDGGKLWQQASVGWNARGANAFVIDPKNADHVIGVGGNSMDWGENWGQTPHGLYLSTNRAASWKHVLGVRDGLGGAVAFDLASYASARKLCTVAYYASHQVGLYKTTDGGANWSKVSAFPVGKNLEDHLFLKVHPQNGVVYLGGKGGFWRSGDGGRTFAKTLEGDVWGMDTAPKLPDNVYVCGTNGVQVSRDSGKTFTTITANGLDRQNGKPVQTLSVSPADPKRMSAWIQGNNWQWKRYTSQNGGANWQEWKINKGLAPLPQNVRQGYAAWHPTNPNRVYGIGGDWVTRSDDGGKTFTWANNGYNGVMLGGLFNFSKQTPDTVFLGFQDYNAAFTLDGGKVWNYRDASGKGWGGHCYGGYAANSSVMYYGDAEDWGSKRRLRITFDGGAHWQFAKDADGKEILLSGTDVSCGSAANPEILFASNYRSGDQGKSWQPMSMCEGVYTSNVRDNLLFGKKGNAVVKSADNGASWQIAATAEGGIDDIAVDAQHGFIYVASQDRLKCWQNGAWETIETPHDQYGNQKVVTVALDPQAPDVIYVGGPRNIYASHATVCRSVDGGRHWTNLTMNTPLDQGGTPSPHEVSAIRVHPVTRQAWVNGQCYGMWRIAPPKSDEKGKTALEASAPKAETPPFAPPSEPTITMLRK